MEQQEIMDKTLGLDYSRYQDDDTTPVFNDFNKAKEQGAFFCFIKATQNDAYIDPDFVQNWNDSKVASLLRGAYHYYQRGVDPIAQALHFFDTVSTTGDIGELPPVIDVENGAIKANDLRICCEKVEELFNRKPLLYLSDYSWSKVTGDKTWARDYRIWLAQYPYDNILQGNWFDEVEFVWIQDKLPNLIPNEWTIAEVEFWQFTSKLNGFTFGVESFYLDGDFFMGTVEELFYKYGEIVIPIQVRFIGTPELVYAESGGQRVGSFGTNENAILTLAGEIENNRVPVVVWVNANKVEFIE